MTSRRRARRPLLAPAAIAAALATACGVSGEPSARFEAGDDVPYGLLESTTTTAGGTGGPAGPATTEVCLVVDAEGRLASVERAVPERATPADALAALATGPTDDEVDLGLSTALPDDPFGEDASSSGGVVTVDLAPAFAGTAGRRQLLAVAQVVCTLTARPGVGQVWFTLDGDPVEVPRGDGAATSDPVARDDYRGLLGRPG